MKQILKIFILTTLAFQFISCDNDTPMALLLNNYDITLEQGRSVSINILQGNGEYLIQSNNKNIAEAEVENNFILINAISPGLTYILVKDKEKETTIISVHVEQTKDILLNSTHIMLVPGLECSIEILQGTTEYNVISSDNNIVTVESKTDKNFNIRGYGIGNTTITVTDVEKVGKTASFKVTVIEDAQLSEEVNFSVATPDHPEGLPSSAMGISFSHIINNNHLSYKAKHVRIEKRNEISGLPTRKELCVLYNQKEKYETIEYDFYSYNNLTPMIVNDNEVLRLIIWTGYSGQGDGQYHSELRFKERH